LMAVVVKGERGRIYLPASMQDEVVADNANPEWKPDVEFLQQALGFRVGNYGMTKWSDLFTRRQLVALTTFSDLVAETREKVRNDALLAGKPDNGKSLHEGGKGATAYADAVATYLGFLVDQQSNQSSTLCGWNNINQQMIVTFSRQTVTMIWDYAECNVFSKSTGSIWNLLERQVKGIASLGMDRTEGLADQLDASVQQMSVGKVVATDPPYYDNIGYADLSDFFYVWLRHSLHSVYPDIFSTLTVPKAEELVATPARHGGRREAETFFVDGMTKAMNRISEQAHPSFPVCIFYAFKQSETDGADGVVNTGWDTFLAAVIEAGFSITGTWPIKTESANKLKATKAFLASSVVLACRKRGADAKNATRGEFVAALKTELPLALNHLQRGNIAPVDLAQASIGPGMAVYSRYEKVIDVEGNPLTVREALALINEVLDEALVEQEGDFDADTRWALTWFEQSGFADGEYGMAEQLSKSKNTSVSGMERAGILTSKGSKVRLLSPSELPDDWEPNLDGRLTAWVSVHQLVKALESGAEPAAATLVGKLGARAETARELAYRLFVVSERNKRPVDALSYNSLVRSWPEITRLVREESIPEIEQSSMFSEDEV